MKILRGKSGITVLFRPMKTGLVDMRYYVKVGAVDESPEEWGYCHALEHMVFAGTEKRTWLDINREWEKYGIWYNASTWHDRTIYQTTGLKKYWKESYEILADMFYNCQFPEDRWEAVEKPAVLSEIQADLDDEEIELTELLYQRGVGARYHSIVGGLNTIQNATIEDLTRFYKEYYQGNNVFLVVTGDLTEKQLMGVVNRYDCLQTRGPVKRKKFQFDFNYAPIKRINHSVQQGYLQTLMPLKMPRTYRTRVGLCLGVSCLSQYLFEELREKRGLVYGASASLYWDIPDQVFLWCKTATGMENVDKTQKAFRTSINNFLEFGLSSERINNMKMSELYAVTTEQAVIGSSAKNIWEDYTEGQVDINPYRKYIKLIEHLPVESIRNTTRLHVRGKYKFGKIIGSK
jgi:predicted Zn-dependent peptidase